MNNDAWLIAKLMALPEEMRMEVSRFVDFLLYKDHAPAQNNTPDQPSDQARAKAGFGQVHFTMRPDFDEPLDDFNEYMP